MRNFIFQLLLAAFFLASFCGATSPDTTQDSRLFSSANSIERATMRVLRVPSTTTDKSEERGIFSGLFKVKTTYLDTQTLSGIDDLMATFKGLKGKSGDELDTAIAVIATKTNVDVADLKSAYSNYKAFGASNAKKALTLDMESNAEMKFIDNIADTLVARFEGKSWPEVWETFKVTKADPRVIHDLYGDYTMIGKGLVKRTLLNPNKVNVRELHNQMKLLN